jgi:drug/metabolite transporter (DMT)-like permease
MFIGEFLCLLAHAINRRRQPAQPGSLIEKGTFWFAIPGCCDIIGTGVMYSGLCLSSASIFQMLRGSVVVFTAILSRVWLKRKIYGFQWCAVASVVVGISIVGSASLKNLPKGKDQTGVLVGDILIILGQMVTAFHMCCEE